MKTALTITRSIGVLGATWIIYMAFYAYSSMAQQTQDVILGSSTATHPLTLHIWQSTVPFCLLALLIVVPYKRISKIYSIIGALLIGTLSIYFMSFLFGQYFLAARFVPSSIPTGIWIYSSMFVVFFISQIVAIAIQNKKVEQCDPPNGYPRHASC
jgi:hypothetical protein